MDLDSGRPTPPVPKPPTIPLLTVALLLVLAGLWLARSGPSQAPLRSAGVPQAAAPAAALVVSGDAPMSLAPPPPADTEPMPACWSDLLAFDEGVTLADLRAALADAVANGDALRSTYLQERLAELVGEQADAAFAVIGWAERAAAPGPYLEALKGTAAVQNPAVAERLLALGERPGAPALRRSALEALETQRSFGAEAIRRVKAIALDETSDEVAWMATRTLGRVMQQDFERTGTFEPYVKELLDIGRRSADAAVRALALEMPAYANPLLGRSAIDKLSHILRTDPDRHVREAAAFDLGLTAEPERALAAFRAAFPAEEDLCVRWAMFRFAVRAAGAAALPLLREFATLEPRLRPDYNDFRTLYASGITDFVRIWLNKQERIQCLDEES